MNVSEVGIFEIITEIFKVGQYFVVKQSVFIKDI